LYWTKLDSFHACNLEVLRRTNFRKHMHKTFCEQQNLDLSFPTWNLELLRALKGWKGFKQGDSPHVFRCSFCRFGTPCRKKPALPPTVRYRGYECCANVCNVNVLGGYLGSGPFSRCCFALCRYANLAGGFAFRPLRWFFGLVVCLLLSMPLIQPADCTANKRSCFDYDLYLIGLFLLQRTEPSSCIGRTPREKNAT